MFPSTPNVTDSCNGCRFARALGALLALGLAASAVAATPAVPAPFQNEAIEVALGENGGTIALMTAEDGGFTLDGELFTGGSDNPVEGEGGRMYVLTLVDGSWSATFQPMEVTVALGGSGESVALTTTEAGGYTMGGAAFASGGTASSTAGANYTLTLGANGVWMAAHVPTTQTVALGDFGGSVELMTTEAGTWVLGESQRQLTGDGSDTHSVGDLTYALALDPDGVWSATFVPMPRTVALGSSGESVTLMTTEAGGFTLDGTDVGDGARAVNSVGESYALALGADGTWSAAHQPMQASVRLGTSGTVTLVTTEGGRWTLDGDAVSSGQTVARGDNAATGAKNVYELTLSDGTWTATYRPLTTIIPGSGGMEAAAREDGSGYDVGDITLPASGVGDLAGPGGAVYRVAKNAEGMLAAMRYDLPIVGDVMHVNAEGEHGAPSLSADTRDTAIDETGTQLKALGASFSVGDLLDGGAAAAAGPNIVAKARGEIVKIRDRVEGLVALRQDDGISSEVFKTQLDRQWDAADRQVRTVFGGTETLERTTSERRVVDAFDRLLDALGSEEAFAAATLADGRDKLQGFHERTASQASTAFNRAKWTAAARMGSLGSTRFGAAVYNSTDNAKADHGDAERAQAFAWSSMESIRRTDMQVSGTATYQGRTLAADGAGNLYAGDFSIAVRFARRLVDGLVTGLADAETQEPWAYGLGGEVTAITLPTATLDRRGRWRVRSSDAEGRLTYVARAGGSEDLAYTDGAFSGRLLGQGETAGSETIGTWKLEIGSTVLAGGFGAVRGADRPNPAASFADNLTADGVVVLRADADGYLDVPLAGSSSGTRVPRKTTIDRSENKLIVAASSADEPWVWRSAVPRRFEVELEELFGGEHPVESVDGFARDSTHEVKQGTHVEAARKEITRLHGQLQQVVGLGNEPFANQQRQRIFDAIQEQLSIELFGPNNAPGLTTISALSGEAAVNWSGAHTDYPASSGGEPRDRTVLSEVQAILDALADPVAFGEAFASDGIFEGLNAFDSTRDGEKDTVIPTHFIFRKEKARMLLSADTTDFTRFGVWMRQSSFYANNNKNGRAWYGGYSGYRDLTTYGEPFAYSPLDQVTYASHMDRGYPGRGAQRTVRASYEGSAAALQHTIFYTAGLDARVFWDSNAVSGQISARFTNPTSTDPAFGALRHGLRDYPNPASNNTLNKPKPGTHDVAALVFTADIVSTDNKIGFTGNTLRIEYDREVRGNRSYPELVAPVLNEMQFINGELRIRHSALNQSSWRRRPAGTYTELTLAWLDTSDLPADGTTTVVRAGTDGTETFVDRFNAAFEDHATTSLDLVSAEYGRYEALASKDSYLLFTFADGTTIQQFLYNLDASGNAGTYARTQSAYGPTITVSQGGELFDEFFSRGKGAGYLNIGYPIGPPADGNDPNFDRTQFFAQEYAYANVGDRDNGFARPMDPADMATRGIDVAGGTTADFYTTVGSSTVGVSAGLSTTARIDGQFVGEHADGPLGMIGVWSLPGNVISDEQAVRSFEWRDHWLGVGNTRAEIVAAFGADFVDAAP